MLHAGNRRDGTEVMKEVAILLAMEDYDYAAFVGDVCITAVWGEVRLAWGPADSLDKSCYRWLIDGS